MPWVSITIIFSLIFAFLIIQKIVYKLHKPSWCRFGLHKWSKWSKWKPFEFADWIKHRHCLGCEETEEKLR